MTNKINEDYVSFETAKLLKEKGFDEGCSFVVNVISKAVMPVSWPTTNSDIEDEKASLIALPTLQMAMKWLRELYDLHIIAYPFKNGNDTSIKHYCCQVFKTFNLSGYEEYIDERLTSYEEAVEAAIKYCLENLI